ncbi:MAG: HIT family protein [Chlamydiota bacterium]|jgi:diadenosine tetraphosphate (Ap4A) HIT family hydrolase
MLKKVLFLLVICSAGVIFFYLQFAKVSSDTPCAFCDKEILSRQKFYEDDVVIALYTHKPIVPSHFLIIPKRHVERLEMLSQEEILHIHQVIQKVNGASNKVFHTSAYLIHQKNGSEMGQSVPHVHFHLIAKQSKDSSSFKFFVNMIIANVCSPISSEAMQQVTDEMKMAMDVI